MGNFRIVPDEKMLFKGWTTVGKPDILPNRSLGLISRFLSHRGTTSSRSLDHDFLLKP